MNSLLDTFQRVIDVGREDPLEGLEASPSSGDAGLLDGVVGKELGSLPDDVNQLKKLLLAKHHGFNVLYAESMELQKKLARATRHLTLQRDLWLSSLESQESTIEALTEAAAAGRASPGQASSAEKDGVYVTSLLEQVESLKAALTSVTMEKEAAQLALAQELRQQAERGLLQRSGLAGGDRGGETAEEHQAALRKLDALWEKERMAYERQIDELTSVVQRGVERMEALSKKQGERLQGEAAGATDSPEDRSTPRDDGRENSPERRRPHTSVDAGVPPSSTSHADPEAGPAAATTAETPRKGGGGEDSDAALFSLREQVEELQRESRAREEALSAMYEENKRLEESNRRLNDRLAHFSEESARGATDSDALQRLLHDEERKNRALTAALEESEQAQSRLQHHLQALQDTMRRERASGVAASSTAVPGSRIPSASRTAGEARSLHLRTTDFVTLASAKLAAGKRSPSALGAQGPLRILLALVLALTVLMFLSLALGGGGPATQYEDAALRIDSPRRVDSLPRALNRSAQAVL